MKLLNIKLNNFRNHIDSSYDLENELIITGLNGSGKTSILESIYVLFSFKTFKKQPINALINFNSDFLRIESNIMNKELLYNSVYFYDKKRSTKLNGEEILDLGSYLYNNPIALYTPEYLGVLSKEQSDRRNFIDKFLFYSDISYLQNLKTYNRLIAQKQTEFNKDYYDKIYIDTLNDEIIKLSNIIYEKRKKFISNINNELKNIYSLVDFNIENVYLGYSSNTSEYDLLDKEKIFKKNLYGIHRDKINMILNNNLIEKFSSTGQKKTFNLLSIYCFIKYIEDLRKINIITLLDDFEAALDMNRAIFLKDLFSSKRQVIYTGIDNLKLKFNNEINLI